MKFFVLSMWLSLFVEGIYGKPNPTDMVAFAGNLGHSTLNNGIKLSDGSFLVAGKTNDLSWLPATVPKTILPSFGIDSKCDSLVGFLLHFSADLQSMKEVFYFPKGTVKDIFKIRSTEIPGQATGEIYISGSRENQISTKGIYKDGYFIAKLNNNFVRGLPTGLSWLVNVDAAGDIKTWQPWDLTSEGSVYYVLGKSFDASWSAIYKLSPSGTDTTVAGWTTHWIDDGAGGQNEINVPDLSFYNRASGNISQVLPSSNPVIKSGIVLKPGRGGLRSWTQNTYAKILQDGKDSTKQGNAPNDYFYSGPIRFDSTTFSVSEVSGPGYTGYNAKSTTHRCVAITVDRRNNHLYFGYSVQSILPGGNPDFEPAIVAMDQNGNYKWWSRLYRENQSNSTPDQYVDDIAIDYSVPVSTLANTIEDKKGALVVVARSHGNNVVNFWSMLNGFQKGFTGTNGNIHVSWIGRFALNQEKLLSATYMGELNEGQNPGGTNENTLLQGWYNVNTGWPQLNSTKVFPGDALQVDLAGNIYVIASGRQPITTSNAYIENLKPGEDVNGKARTWSNFVRVYNRDLTDVLYSSLFNNTDALDTSAGEQNSNLSLLLPIQGGLLLGGSIWQYHGFAPPSAKVPSWGKATVNVTGEDLFLAQFNFENYTNAIIQKWTLQKNKSQPKQKSKSRSANSVLWNLPTSTDRSNALGRTLPIPNLSE